jgi:Kef-type K+ transport system membrane component KefB
LPWVFCCCRWRCTLPTRSSTLSATLPSGTAIGLAEVAERVGYGSEAALSRAFKRWVGVAPPLWRKGQRSQNTPAAEVVPTSRTTWRAVAALTLSSAPPLSMLQVTRLERLPEASTVASSIADSSEPRVRLPLRVTLGYGLLIAIALGIFAWIRSVGAGLIAPSPAKGAEVFGAAPEAQRVDVLLHLLLALAVVIVAARLVGLFFRRLGQPPVIGEVIAGIMLGPSLLGRLAPAASAYLLPPSIAPVLGIIAQLGVIIYMFLVGLQLDTRYLRRSPSAALSISHASIIIPFLLGSSLALVLYPAFSSSDVPFTVFALFMGISMSVTAFPVLARILTDRGLQRTRLGSIAIICAAIDDITAWCLLAFVVALARTRPLDAVWTLALSLLFVTGVLTLGRHGMRALARSEEGRSELSAGALSTALAALLLCAFATEWIGIHALFGAFVLGGVIAHDSLLARGLARRLQDLVVVLLPAFFAFTGLRTQIGLVSSGAEWALCALIIGLASLGKFGGTLLAARVTGLAWRDGTALGILMNTRGMMELIVLNIGLDLKVISPTLFAMLVLMAVVTTVATTPILDRLNRGNALLDYDQPEAPYGPGAPGPQPVGSASGAGSTPSRRSP